MNLGQPRINQLLVLKIKLAVLADEKFFPVRECAAPGAGMARDKFVNLFARLAFQRDPKAASRPFDFFQRHTRECVTVVRIGGFEFHSPEWERRQLGFHWEQFQKFLPDFQALNHLLA